MSKAGGVLASGSLSDSLKFRGGPYRQRPTWGETGHSYLPDEPESDNRDIDNEEAAAKRCGWSAELSGL